MVSFPETKLIPFTQVRTGEETATPLGPLTRERGEGALKVNLGRVVPQEPSTPFLV